MSFLLLENGDFLLLEDGGLLILEAFVPSPSTSSKTPSFGTVTLLSFYEWLDNWLLQRGQAYTNNTSRFYYQPDPTLTGYVA